MGHFFLISKKNDVFNIKRYSVKSFNLFLLLVVSFILIGHTSCSKEPEDILDDAQTTNLLTKYGEVVPTGTKTFNLYARRSDGPTELKIPGFATIYCLLNYIGAPYLTSEDEANEFYGWGWEKSSSTSVSCFVRVATLNSSTTPYVYAKIELLEYLYGPDNKKIGVKVKYESPIKYVGE